MPMFDFEFMRLALYALLLAAPAFALAGSVVVESRLAFFSDALGHSAFTGVALGFVLGVADPGIAVTVFGLAFAGLLSVVRRGSGMSGESVISVFASAATALGLALLSGTGNYAKFSGFLIGDILAVEKSDIVTLAALCAAVFIYLAFSYRRLMLISVSPSLAASKGVRVDAERTLFMLVLSVVVTATVHWVGILLVNSLLVLPAAAARNVSRNLTSYAVIGPAFALVSAVAGLAGAYAFDIAAGPAISLAGAAIFFVTYLFRKKVRN